LALKEHESSPQWNFLSEPETGDSELVLADAVDAIPAGEEIEMPNDCGVNVEGEGQSQVKASLSPFAKEHSSGIDEADRVVAYQLGLLGWAVFCSVVLLLAGSACTEGSLTI
jgi:hypothetical protein